MAFFFFSFFLRNRGQLQETKLYFVVTRGLGAGEVWSGWLPGSRVQVSFAKVNPKLHLWERPN